LESIFRGYDSRRAGKGWVLVSMKRIEPYALRKFKNIMARVKCCIFDFYFIALKKIIPCKIVGITLQCPLGLNEKGEGCADILHTGIITDKPSFELKDVLDCVFKSVRRHLDAKHNIKHFEALEFKAQSGKYTIYVQ